MSEPPLSRARHAGDLLFVSGQLPRREDGAIMSGGIAAQAERALDNLRRALEAEGCDLADVVKTTVWLTDPGDAPTFNQVYRTFFADPFPARSMVVSALLADGALVEIEAIARLG
jgi:reactive intermediate/imine deaminase